MPFQKISATVINSKNNNGCLAVLSINTDRLSDQHNIHTYSRRANQGPCYFKTFYNTPSKRVNTKPLQKSFSANTACFNLHPYQFKKM